MSKSIFLLFLIVSLNSFAGKLTYRDKSLKKSEAPTFLLKAVPDENVEDVEYFKKSYSDGTSTYEVKYEVKDEEVSVTYSADGVFLEKEEDIKFSTLAESIRAKIEKHLEEKYKKYKIMEAELRTTKDQKKLIDVEVAHDKGTGLTELSYSTDGTYVSEEEEEVKQIETLN